MLKSIFSLMMIFLLAFIACTSAPVSVPQDQASQSKDGELSFQETQEVDQPEEILKEFYLEVGNTPSEIKVGQSFLSNFYVVVKDKETQLAVSGEEVSVTYPAGKKDGVVLYETEIVVSDGDGYVFFVPVKTTFSCNDTVTFEIHSKDGIATAEIPYKVSTNLYNRGGNISIVDYTKNGNPVTSNSQSASALLLSFMRNGFSKIGLMDFVQEIHTDNTAEIQRQAYNMVGNQSAFIIYGTVKYDGEVTQKDGKYQVPLVSTLTAMDIKTGKKLCSTEIKVIGQGNSEWEAMENARKDLWAPQATEFFKYNMDL